MNKLETIFLQIKAILEKHGDNFIKTDQILHSKAKLQKVNFHLYGNKKIRLFSQPPKHIYIAGTIQQKNYVSFYLPAIYSHPNLLEHIGPGLKENLKGKGCFNIQKLTPDLLWEIEEMLKIGINKYIELQWV